MRGAPVRIFNRYTGTIEEEAIFGEAALRWTYETIPGRLVNRAILCRPVVSRFFGWYMKRPASAQRIRPFIESYGIDASEFRLEIEAYRSFNDFFCRELREGVRPIDPDPDAVVFPADGRHLAWENIGEEDWIFVKGRRWDLYTLLGGDDALVRRFSGGSLVLSRLCPLDYHHFHYPVGGVVGETRAVKGPLHSVNPVSLRRSLRPLLANYRCVSLIRSSHTGLVCFIEVGATNVGSIHHRPLPTTRRVQKGDPKGWFEFGGSSVLTLFEPDKIELCNDLKNCSREGIELYARMGDRLGHAG